MDEQEEGYSGLFYVMLILGIVGVLGFLMVAAGPGRWVGYETKLD